jgi:dethiobiotin synthetase
MEDGSIINPRSSILGLGVLMGGGLFITGTDTGVGKTFFACCLAALLKESGYKIGVMKPAETGCDQGEGKLVPQDALALKRASDCELPLETICPYRFHEPLAPSVAADRRGVRIEIDRLMSVYSEINAVHDITIVEGAGGLMVPLLASYTYADFARVLKLPLIVVAANKLGMINHLLLTLEHASCHGLRVLGYVLNQIESQPSLAAETNREALISLTGVPCIGELPYVEHSQRQNAPPLDLIDEQFDLRSLESVVDHRYGVRGKRNRAGA